MTAEFGLIVVKDMMDASVDGLRNMDFPNVSPITVEAWMHQIWGKKA